MVYFDGTYRLKPYDEEGVPIGKWSDAWRIRIIDQASVPTTHIDLKATDA